MRKDDIAESQLALVYLCSLEAKPKQSQKTKLERLLKGNPNGVLYTQI